MLSELVTGAARRLVGVSRGTLAVILAVAYLIYAFQR